MSNDRDYDMGRLNRRDRLEYPMCEDEPSDAAYQPILDTAYAFKYEKNLRLGNVYDLLEQNKHLDMSLYQKVRTEFLFAEYFMEVDSELDARGVPDYERDQDPVGKAIEHYRLAADIAWEIPDRALYAQLKILESDVCYFSHPYRNRYRRAFESARQALDAWTSLPNRNLTSDMMFAFKLGDAVGVRGQMVTEDAEAVRGLDYASLMLYHLQERSDVDAAEYAHDGLILDWNWVFLYYTMGLYRQSFKNARETRRKGPDLNEPKNRSRHQRLIASIMLASAEEGQIGDYSRNRLLAAGERAIDEAYRWSQVTKDEGEDDRAGYAMILLSEAKWMGISRKVDGRTKKIEQAAEIATLRNDPLLLGQVEIAWGDEYVFQNLSRFSKQKAKEAEIHYRDAIAMLTDVQALSLARIAQRRLDRFISGQIHSPRKRTGA